MKSLKFFLLTLVSLSSYTVIAQNNLAAVYTEKKDAKTAKPYTIHEMGAKLNKATLRRDLKSTGNIIEIEALNVSGGSISLGNATTLQNGILPAANVSNITSVIGNYLSTRDISKSGRGVVMQLLDVVYPYRARITVSEQILEFEINEPGFWKLNIAVSQ